MLQDQTIPVSFGQGLDTKTDEKQVIPGKLTALENGNFTSLKAISKRAGYDALPKTIMDNTTISGADGLANFRPVAGIEELIQFASNKVYSYSPNSSKWIDRGQTYSVGTYGQSITRNYSQIASSDFARVGNVEVYGWIDTTKGKAKATVLDANTGAQYVSNFDLGTYFAQHLKVVAFGSYIFVLWSSASGKIAFRRLDTASPNTFGIQTDIITDISATITVFDAVVDNSKLIFGYFNGTNISVKQADNTGTVTASTTITGTVDNCISVVANSNIFVYWHNNTNGTRYAVVSSALASVLAQTTIDSTTTPKTLSITAAAKTTTTQAVFYHCDGGTNPHNYFIQVAQVDSVGSPIINVVLVRSVGLASKAFAIGSSQYFLAAQSSALQATYFLIRNDGVIVGKAQAGASGAFQSGFDLPQAVSVSGTLFAMAEPVIIKTTPLFNTTDRFAPNVNQLGVTKISFDFSPPFRYRESLLGSNLHMVGGFMSAYDGVSVVEHGFHLYPENISGVAGVTGGATGLTDGNYQYAVLYEWIDNQGQIHRSSPSVPLQIVMSGSAGKGQFVLTIPTLRLTAKTAPRQEVAIQIYRTPVNGTTFYNVLLTSAPTLFNDPTVDSVSYTDFISDSPLTSNELLYTNGGVLENDPAPPCSVVDVYQNRMVVNSTEDPLAVYYSKKKQKGEGVLFNAASFFRVDPLGGDITALKMMDDKILIFKQNNIFAVAGEGPNDTGEQNSYTTPTLITSDVGCAYPNSVLLVPNGVMFKSNKGIYLVNRSLQVSYIGAEVESFNSQNVTAATLLQDKNQVRFLTDSGATLVYDYFLGQWSTYTNFTGNDAVQWKGVYRYLRADGTVFSESASNFQDNSTNQSLRVVTSWLKLSGVQGFQRVRRFAILANYKSAHSLRVRVYYDYDNVNFTDYIFNAAAVIGSSAVPYQFRGHLAKQKCEAIKFDIIDTSAGALSEGYSITDITLEVAVKGGIKRLKSAASV